MRDLWIPVALMLIVVLGVSLSILGPNTNERCTSGRAI